MLVVIAALSACGIALISGCAADTDAPQPEAPEPGRDAGTLPEGAYYVDETLPEWIDPETGYDTTREWNLDGGTWPVCIVMSPSQSPQLLVAERDGLLAEAFTPFGITPVVEKLELPPRTFHALQRSKWPFVYMPYAVYTDYCRTNDNQGGAGGLQYVALAGSTAGGGYTLITRDPEIQSVADLAGKTVAGMENNPARIVLVQSALEAVGLESGDAEGQVRLVSGESAADLNDYLAGKYDAVVVLGIVKDRFLRTGSHVLTDFTDAGYTPNYTILCVERSVLEQRPEVVDAFLEMHYQANVVVQKEDPAELNGLLMASWNGYFEGQNTEVAVQRIAPDPDTFGRMLGNMVPEQRLDPNLLADCFAYLDENDAWGWDGRPDRTRLLALDRYDTVLGTHGEAPQSAASR